MGINSLREIQIIPIFDYRIRSYHWDHLTQIPLVSRCGNWDATYRSPDKSEIYAEDIMDPAPGGGRVHLLKLRRYSGNCCFDFYKNHFHKRKLSSGITIIKTTWFYTDWF